VLVGQPELDEKLDSVGLRQLKQRIALRAHLGSLDADETREYIERRLRIAGAGDRSTAIFPPETVVSIFRASRGIPRLINSISENALIAAYARQSPVVTPNIVEDVAQEFRLESFSTNGEKARDGDVQRAADVHRSPFSTSLQSLANEPKPIVSIGGRGK
jgi:general secretion pathway protein A